LKLKTHFQSTYTPDKFKKAQMMPVKASFEFV
jgi:hypothetical protein